MIGNGRVLRAGCLLWAGLMLWFAATAWGDMRDPNGVAVIVGTGTYRHERVPEAAYAHRDAAAFTRYVLDVLGYDPQNVIELTDAAQVDVVSPFGNERSHEGELWSWTRPAARMSWCTTPGTACRERMGGGTCRRATGTRTGRS